MTKNETLNQKKLIKIPIKIDTGKVDQTHMNESDVF